LGLLADELPPDRFTDAGLPRILVKIGFSNRLNDMVVSKTEIFDQVRTLLAGKGLSVKHEDQSRPWGGFFVLDETEINKFLHLFFEGNEQGKSPGQKLSPKVLLVAPASRLSWQYHNRRSEIWTVIKGPVKVVMSDTDQESQSAHLDDGASISLKQGQRHRLIGLNTWGIVAEIWQHVNPSTPSDEEDIIRVQDDYNR
jgi:mannose-6-phosphate isomerase